MLQDQALFGLFLIFEHFLAKNRGFVATGGRKTSALRQQQLIPVGRKAGDCNMKLLAKILYYEVSTLMNLVLTQIYVRNKLIKG